MSGINIIPLFVVIPLGASFLISLFGKFIRRFADIAAFVTSLSLLACSGRIMIFLQNTPGKLLIYKIGGWSPPFGICLVIDGLSMFMLFIINLIGFFVTVYSVAYMEKYTDKSKFFTLFSLMICGMNGAVITGDIFNLFVFLEIASIASYALVAFGTGHEELEASFKYAIMGSVASCFIFMGIAFLYGFTSTLNMADMAKVLSYKQGNFFVPFIGVLFLMGFGLKSALMPFHAWLPDAHSSAPAPVSAMLSGVLIKALGVYSLLRIFFNILGSTQVFLSALMFLSVISIIIGGILSLSQWNLKRLMAYSSISQIGYILLGVGLGTPLGIFGALFHLLNHSVMKSLLFLTAGSIDYAGGGKDLREMSGISRQMPFTAKANMIASMSVSGIPPFSGFFSKLIIIIACIQKGHIGYGVCAVIGSVLTLSAFMKIQKFTFFGEVKDNLKKIKEVPWLMKFSMGFLALFCIIGGLMLLPGMRFFISDAVQVIAKGTSYSSIILEAALK